MTDDPLERLRRLRGARGAGPARDEEAPRRPAQSMTDVLSLPDDLRGLATWLMRHGEAGAAQAAAQIGGDEATARGLLDRLVAEGYAEVAAHDGTPRYRARVGAHARPRLPGNLWKALE